MRTQSIILSIISLFVFNSYGFSQQAKSENVKVWGNCGMCKKTIETAAKNAGASKASWDTETKELTVSYKSKKTNLTSIQQAIAAVGYDTRDFTAPDEAYSKLHSCCQYDRKEATSSAAKADCCNGTSCSKDGGCCKDGKCEKCKETCKDSASCKEKGCCKS